METLRVKIYDLVFDEEATFGGPWHRMCRAVEVKHLYRTWSTFKDGLARGVEDRVTETMGVQDAPY